MVRCFSLWHMINKDCWQASDLKTKKQIQQRRVVLAALRLLATLTVIKILLHQLLSDATHHY